jgi:LPXTG-motif cell wall-anchored protein
MFPGLSPIGIVRLIVAILISAGAVLAGLLFFLSFRRRNNPLL